MAGWHWIPLMTRSGLRGNVVAIAAAEADRMVSLLTLKSQIAKLLRGDRVNRGGDSFIGLSLH